MQRQIKIPAVRFNLKNHKPTDKSVLISLIFRYKGKRLVYSTGEKINPVYWDSRTQRPKYTRKHPEYVEMNERLNNLEKLTIQIFKDSDFGKISLNDFKTKLNIRSGKIEIEPNKKKLPLIEFINQFIEESKQGNKRTLGTIKKIVSVRNHLLNFAKEKNKKLNYEDIDWHFKKDFEAWLYDEPRQHSVNTAHKIFKIIKQLMRASCKLGYHSNLIVNDKEWTPKQAKTKNKVHLNFDELNQLKILKLDSEKLEKTRDLFLVGCYTGLRFSDWHKVGRENIILDEGSELLEILTEKTKQLVYIPCLPELKTILKRYDYQLPKISEQKFNNYIKIVCEIASIDTKFLRIYSESGTVKKERIEKYKKVSSHAARRSFASNFYDLEIPPYILMQITGHTTEKQFFEYIDVDQKKLARKFAKIADMNAKKRHLKVI